MARRGLEIAEKQPQQRRLARAIRAEQPKDLAFLDAERTRIQSDKLVIPLRQRVRFDKQRSVSATRIAYAELFGGDRAHHATASSLGRGFELAELGEFLDHTFHDLLAFFDMRHLATTKQHRDLDLVLVLQERYGLFDLKVDIVLASLGPQPDLFRFRRVTVLVSLLLFLVLVLAIVHDFTDRRLRVRCHLDQIKARFTSFRQRVVGGKYPQLRPIVGNDTDRGNLDVVVNSRFYAVDLKHPFELVWERGWVYATYATLAHGQ